MKKITLKMTGLLFVLWGALCPALAQNNIDTKIEVLQKQIMKHDAEFWEAYNTCDTEAMAAFMTDDFEFYHDKGGLTVSSERMIQLVKKGLCGNDEWKLRREAIAGTVKVYPLNGYGAIMEGEHLFYETVKGQEERLVEKAKFTHVWKNENGTWKMSRALSFNHQPVRKERANKEISISEGLLEKYAGKYNAPQTGIVTILKNGSSLEMQAGKMHQKIKAETQTLFFMDQTGLTFEFVEGNKGEIEKLIVRENGQIVEEAVRID